MTSPCLQQLCESAQPGVSPRISLHHNIIGTGADCLLRLIFVTGRARVSTPLPLVEVAPSGHSKEVLNMADKTDCMMDI